MLNGLAAICLIVGFFFITRRNIKAHRRSMMTAFVFSSLFLVCYILNHALHGDTLYQGHGPLRTVYFSILISHITLDRRAAHGAHHLLLLAHGPLPAAQKDRALHSPYLALCPVTGVIVFAMLHAGAR